MVWGALVGLGASALSGFLNASSAKDAAQDSLQNSLILQASQNAFTKKMSDTAHQREVADLRKAGLNPLLSATGGSGASTPAAGSATVNTNDPRLGDSIASALDFLRYKNEKELKDSTKDVNASTVKLNESNANKAQYEADSAHEFAAYQNEQTRQLMEYGPILKSLEAQKVQNDIINANLTTAAQVKSFEAQAKNYIADTVSKYKQASNYREEARQTQRSNDWFDLHPNWYSFGQAASALGNIFRGGLSKSIK